MEILEIVRRSHQPVVPGGTRHNPVVTGFPGTMTKRDVTPYHGDVTACLMLPISTLFVCSQQQIPMQHGKLKSEFGKTSMGPLSTIPLR
eukprot:1163958-Amorphochlora_amoeboformis.AAC.1